MKKIESLLLAALMVLSIINIKITAKAEGTGVSSYEELASAVKAAQGETHIVLEGSFTFETKGTEPQITIKAGNIIVLETGESGVVLSHGTGGVMFFVEDGASLVLEGHENAAITLRETVMTEEWAESCIAADGKLEARNVVIEGFYAESGAAVFLSDRGAAEAGTDCVLNECEFSGNHAVRGGAIYVGEGRKAEIYASSFTSNTAGESGNDAYVAGQLIYGDNNVLTAYGPLDYETEPDGSFRYAGQICGTGSFEISERTSVSGVISWSADSETPESVQVILLADGQETEKKTVQANADGYWDFSFSNLPLKNAGTAVLYDIGTYEVPGFRFSKRGEADVGFEILYAANPQGDDSRTPEMPEEQTEAAPEKDTPAVSAEKSENAVSVTKSPTDEKAEIGGQAIFIAKAENSTGITWHLVSPGGTEDYRDEEMTAVFTSLELEGLGTEKLKIKVIPLSLNGWKVRAEFAGEGGPVFSTDAVITVNGADNAVPDAQAVTGEEAENPDQTEPDEATEETAEAEIVETPSESPEAEPKAAAMVELLKSPTNEIVELDGNAIFIARAENALKIVWHIISPDDTVDYADEQALTAFEGVQIEGLGTEKIKILHIPVAMNGWKVQAEFVGEANRVLSEKAAVLIKDYENLYQADAQLSANGEAQTGAEELSGEEKEQSQEVSPVPAEVKENNSGNTEEISAVQVNTTEDTQRSIQVVALWNDNMNAAGQRPDMTIVELYRDDALYFTAVLNNSNNWMYSFGNLPEGSYRIKESAVSAYDVSYTASGDTVTIMHTFSGMNGQPAVSTDLQPSAAPQQPAAENNTAAATQSPAASPTEEPAAETPAPTATAQQLPEQPKENAGQEEDSWEISTQSSKNSTLVIMIGILGGFGVICAAVAVYLIRKMK